jgi:hypothetical protein
MTTSRKKYYLLFIGLILLLVSAFPAIHYYREKKEKEQGKVFVWVKPIQTPLGWGYDIIADEKIYIHQEFIPAVSGKHGFKTKEDALTVGKKVIEKISTGKLPSLTIRELKEMGVLNNVIAAK